MLRREGRKTWKAELARLVEIAFLSAAILLMNSCGSEKESTSEVAPAPATVAPIVKPDVAGVKVTPKAFMTSANLPGSDPAQVGDGDTSTGWSAGATPPQWIQLDLGERFSISEVLLSVDQYPDGETTHEVYGGPTPESLKLIGTLKGDTRANQWLELKAAANDVRFVKIATVASPSWVGWHEIEIYK